MSDHNIFRDVLMDHYHNPRNRGDLTDADIVRRGSNPRCGDEIEVGVNFSEGKLSKVMFHGRGCSICLASASMMTEAVIGKTKQDALQLAEGMKAWFNADGDKPAGSLQALEVVRDQSIRKRCVLLAWEALDETLATE